MKRRSRMLVGLVLMGGCAAGPTSESTTAVTQRTSALAGASAGPLVLGLSQNEIFLATSDPSNPFPGGTSVPFTQGDAIAAVVPQGGRGGPGVALLIAHGIGSAGTVVLTDQTGATVSPGVVSVFPGFIPYTSGGAVALGDVNGDGAIDVISTTGPFQDITLQPEQVVVSVGFDAPGISDIALQQLGSPLGGALVVCDFDGDGVDDIIVAPSFMMYSGKTGTVSQVVPAPVGSFQSGDKLACGDLNGDGFEDLVIGSVSGFQAVSFPIPREPALTFFTGVNANIALSSTEDDIAVGDLDGDGLAELVVLGQANGQGTPVVYSMPGKTPPSFPTIDSFGDGSKVAIPKHVGPITQSISTSVVMPFLVDKLQYVPPTDKGLVSYLNGMTLGTSSTTTFTISASGGVASPTGDSALKTSLGALSGSASVGYVHTINNQDVRTTTVTTTEGIRALPGKDLPDHIADQYTIHFNIIGTFDGNSITWDMSSGTVVTGITPRFLMEVQKSLPVDIVTVDANGNDVPALVEMKALVEGLTPDQASLILSMDPFFTGEDITQNPARFMPLIPNNEPDNVIRDFTGPTNVCTSDPVATFSTSMQQTHTSGTGNGLTATASAKLGIFTASITTQYLDVEQMVSGTTTGESITLESDHCGSGGDISLYQDLMFGGSILTLQTTTQGTTCPPLPPTCTCDTIDTTCDTQVALSFEVLADWQMQNGGSSTLSTVAAAGTSSLSVAASPSGWTPIVSIPLASSELRAVATSSDLSKVSFALSIPTTQPNPYWVGDAQMFISSPTANVFNQPLGEVNLTGLPEGQFNRIDFTIPNNALPAITGDNPDVTFTIVLNVNAGTSGWLVDDLQIGD